MIQPGTDSVPDGASASNIFVVSETFQSNRKIGSVVQTFRVQQSQLGDHKIINRTILQSLYMLQRAARTFVRTVTDIFAPFQSQRKVKAYKIVGQTLYLSQTVVGAFGKPAINTFAMTQAATYTARRNLTSTQTFSPVSSGKGYLPDPCFIGTPTVSIGGPNGEPDYIF